MKKLLAFLFVAMMPLATAAADIGGPFLPTPSPPLEPTEAVSVKKVDGCDVTIEEGRGYKKVTAGAGQTFTYRYDESGRLQSYSSPVETFDIVYDQFQVAIGFISRDGTFTQIVPLGSAFDFARQLRAAGRLPNLHTLVGTVCRYIGPKATEGELDDINTLYALTYGDVWFDMATSDMDNYFAGLQSSMTCQPDVPACQNGCDNAAGWTTAYCAAAGLLASRFSSGLTIGIGIACAFGIEAAKQACKDKCQYGYNGYIICTQTG